MSMMVWRYAQNTKVLFRVEIIPLKHHFWSFLAITFAVFQMILILIPLQDEGDGIWICPKHSNFIQSGFHSFKTPFLVVFGYNNCSVSNPMILMLIPLQNDHDGMGICVKHNILFRAEMNPRKHHFWSCLAITIAVFQIQMILTLIPLQNEYDGMGICTKHSNFIQSGNDSLTTPFLVVFGCSVSNPNDFNSHTFSK